MSPRSPRLASYLSPKCEKHAASAISGTGLYAAAALARHEVVAVKGGYLVGRSVVEQRPELVGNSDMEVVEGLWLVSLKPSEYREITRFLNHSCEPNLGLAGNIVFVAMRSIAAGEELTIDYAMIDDNQDSMICGCRTPSCRGVVAGQDWRRPELQARYGGYFSWYLQRKAGLWSPPPGPARASSG